MLITVILLLKTLSVNELKCLDSIHFKKYTRDWKKVLINYSMSVNKEKMINRLFLSLVTYCRPIKQVLLFYQLRDIFKELNGSELLKIQILISRKKKNSENYPKILFGICKNQRERGHVFLWFIVQRKSKKVLCVWTGEKWSQDIPAGGKVASLEYCRNVGRDWIWWETPYVGVFQPIFWVLGKILKTIS